MCRCVRRSGGFIWQIGTAMRLMSFATHCSLETKEECYAFLEDLCTIKEVLDLSQRLSVAKMLSKGISYTVINTETGASTATISRVSKCCEYGAGGYKTVIARLGENKEQK